MINAPDQGWSLWGEYSCYRLMMWEDNGMLSHTPIIQKIFLVTFISYNLKATIFDRIGMVCEWRSLPIVQETLFQMSDIVNGIFLICRNLLNNLIQVSKHKSFDCFKAFWNDKLNCRTITGHLFLFLLRFIVINE